MMDEGLNLVLVHTCRVVDNAEVNWECRRNCRRMRDHDEIEKVLRLEGGKLHLLHLLLHAAVVATAIAVAVAIVFYKTHIEDCTGSRIDVGLRIRRV